MADMFIQTVKSHVKTVSKIIIEICTTASLIRGDPETISHSVSRVCPETQEITWLADRVNIGTSIPTVHSDDPPQAVMFYS